MLYISQKTINVLFFLFHIYVLINYYIVINICRGDFTSHKVDNIKIIQRKTLYFTQYFYNSNIIFRQIYMKY